jgi:hypothetical protein
MAHALYERLRRSLIATAAVMLLGTVGATCGVVVSGEADRGPETPSAETKVAPTTPAPAFSPADPKPAAGVAARTFPLLRSRLGRREEA